MQSPTAPKLLDIHAPAAPGWWPPAPGWWWLAGGVLALLLAWAGWRAWQRLRARRYAREFDAALIEAGTPPTRLAAMSALLRRAALRTHPESAALDTGAWLAWLDTATPHGPLAHADGVLLREGAWRPDITESDVAAVHPRLRTRFVALRMRRR